MRGVRIVNRKQWLCSVKGDLTKEKGTNVKCRHLSMNLDPAECMAHGNVKCPFRQEITDEDRKKNV